MSLDALRVHRERGERMKKFALISLLEAVAAVVQGELLEAVRCAIEMLRGW